MLKCSLLREKTIKDHSKCPRGDRILRGAMRVHRRARKTKTSYRISLNKQWWWTVSRTLLCHLISTSSSFNSSSSSNFNNSRRCSSKHSSRNQVRTWTSTSGIWCSNMSKWWWCSRTSRCFTPHREEDNRRSAIVILRAGYLIRLTTQANRVRNLRCIIKYPTI